MKSIQSRFNRVQKSRPYLADYACLAEAVYKQNFTRRKIGEHFRKIVCTDDYDPKDSNKLIKHLYQLSKHAEEDTFSDKIASEATEKHKDAPRIVYTHLNRLSVDKEIILL